MMEWSPNAQVFDNDGIDRISNLPSSILGKIVSFLPTKNAIATSILSTRWKTIFPFEVQPLRLYLSDSRSNPTSFMNFVDKLLCETLLEVGCLEMMHLLCINKSYGDAKIISWVCAALRSNVRYLSLFFSLNDSMALFQHLNGCRTLTSLELISVKLCVGDGFVLPNLKCLILCNLALDVDGGMESVNKLIDGCPVIRKLKMSKCTIGNGLLRIESPVLEIFSIENPSSTVYQLDLDAPNLKVLYYIFSQVQSRYFVSEFKSLDVAVFDYTSGGYLASSYWHENCVAKLVTACASTKHLYIADPAMVSPSVQLPAFENLTWLGLGLVMGSIGWKILAHFMCNAPNLKKLTLGQVVGESDMLYKKFESLVGSTPMCLEMNLKEIEFTSFEGKIGEMRLAEYFLKNGKVMKVLRLHCISKDTSVPSIVHTLQSHNQSRIIFFPSWDSVDRKKLKSKFLPAGC